MSGKNNACNGVRGKCKSLLKMDKILPVAVVYPLIKEEWMQRADMSKKAVSLCTSCMREYANELSDIMYRLLVDIHEGKVKACQLDIERQRGKKLGRCGADDTELCEVHECSEESCSCKTAGKKKKKE